MSEPPSSCTNTLKQRGQAHTVLCQANVERRPSLGMVTNDQADDDSSMARREA